LQELRRSNRRSLYEADGISFLCILALLPVYVLCFKHGLISFVFPYLGDDRSLSSSSSDTSHSDVSVGSRLTIWPEQSSASTSQESHGLAAAKGIHLGEEKIHPEGARGITKPPPKPLRSRQLQEIGRQSSSDSGIATGSHSSYSGSFSSYAGSLDICHGDELSFGSEFMYLSSQ